MKHNFLLLMLSSILTIAFIACEEDPNLSDNNEDTPTDTTGIIPTDTVPNDSIPSDTTTTDTLVNYTVSFTDFIINYGNYAAANSTVTAINLTEDTVINSFYTGINTVSIEANVQYASEYDGKIYLLGNSSDKVFFVDKTTFEQSENPITSDIIKPRYCIGDGDYLYVSCYGGDIWTDSTLSYIAKVDLNSNTVEKKIMMEGGPEGLAIANGKLYAALNYKMGVAVMDLASETITEIATPAATSYFEKDNNENLYVTLVSTYGLPSASAGLGYINTTTDVLDTTYLLNGVSSGYVDILEPNADFSKLYLVASSWVEEADETWVQKGSVASFDIATQTFSTFLSGVDGINGIGFLENQLLVFNSEAAKLYAEDGTFVEEYPTGINPFMILSIE